MIIGIDVSRWQSKVDWSLLKSNGVEFVFIKATQGNYMTDQMMVKHVEGANKAGMIIGLYHWCDPTVDAEAQALYFLNAISGLPYKMLSADVEQQWGDWKEWSNGRVTKIVSPTVISQNAKTILETLTKKTKVPTIVYSRASFINTYAKPAQSWLPKYPLWMAHYPYKATSVRTTWQNFLASYKPSISAPALPAGSTKWTFWQFTGDKFILPGCESMLDINYFNGELADLNKFAGITTTTTPPVTMPLTIEERLAKLEAQARSHGWTI
jgi:GH25 family lysozyme M1 (1,4-beta-N-acetylmuramidase)